MQKIYVQETFCKTNADYKEILYVHLHIYIHLPIYVCYTDTHTDNIKNEDV